MHGITEQGRRASAELHEQLSHSRVGLRWERIVRTHVAEIDALVAVHPDVSAHILDALARLVGAGPTDELDSGTLAAAGRVLDDLDRLGGVELRRSVSGLRDELAMARGHSLTELLTV